LCKIEALIETLKTSTDSLKLRAYVVLGLKVDERVKMILVEEFVWFLRKWKERTSLLGKCNGSVIPNTRRYWSLDSFSEYVTR
jgi:hypothetical protein